MSLVKSLSFLLMPIFVQNVDHLSHTHSRIVCVYFVNLNFLPMLCFVLNVALLSHTHNSKVLDELLYALYSSSVNATMYILMFIMLLQVFRNPRLHKNL